LCFVAVSAAFCFSMLLKRPEDAGLGALFLLAGLPFYWFWRLAPSDHPDRRETRRDL
jgi:hypothetical protein